MKLSKRGAMVVLALVAGLLPPAASSADTVGTTFDGYASGSIHGQDGWSSVGSLPGLPGYDHEVTQVPRPLIPDYGAKSLRISNDLVNTDLDNQTFSKSVANEAGELGAAGSPFSGGVRLGHFEAQWDFTSVLASYEPGLKMDFSPDRGAGEPMARVTLEDSIPGLTLKFTDYQSGRFAPGCSDLNFVTTNLGSPTVIVLDRFPVVHTLRITMDFPAGPSNDVVKVFVNGELVHTGTSWEDRYRECEGGSSRTVDSILFSTAGLEGLDDCLECSEGGFFIDNLTIKTLGVRVIPTGAGTTVTEGGPCDTYTLVLEEAPAPNTFVTVSLSTSGDITMSPTSVSFNSSTWNIPRTITVCAIDDTVAELPHTVQIQHTVASTDPNWNGVPVADMPVLVLDNDGPCLITQSGGVTAVVEGGVTDTYTMRLLTAPTANVTVPVTPDAQVMTSTASLVFTPANWNIPQTVTVTAVDDLLIEGLHFGLITHGLTVSADAAFNGQSCASLTAVITDNDPVDVIAPAAPVITNCPPVVTTRTFQLTGTAEPGASVTIYYGTQVWGTVRADATGNWTIQIQFPAPGMYSITAVATDLAGNQSPPSAVCLIDATGLDFTAPAPPVITSPANGAVTPRCVTVTITFDADTDRLLVFDNGVLIANVDVNPPASPFSRQFCFTTGLHRLTAIAIDASGNRSVPSNAVTINVDASPPVIRITKPSLYLLMQISLLNDPTIRGIAYDNQSGIDRVEISYEPLLPLLGAPLDTTATCPQCPSGPVVTVNWFDNPNLSLGLYTVTATAYDRAGNTATADDLLLFII